MIYDIQRFSTHDGAGIRTVIFFKGCALRCPWCENPESQSFDYDLMYDIRRCILCYECTRQSSRQEITENHEGIVIHRRKIQNTLQYRGVCPALALKVIGESKSIAEMIAEVKKDLPFYTKSGGGVTISGGEPYAQAKLLLELLKGLKKIDISVSVETSLYAQWDCVAATLELVDCFLADLKHTDAQKFKKHTGGDLELILQNFKKLEKANVRMVVRVPVIPQFNDSHDELVRIIDFASSLKNVKEINFLPFHTLGLGKYDSLSRPYTHVKGPSPRDKDLALYAEIATKRGLKADIGG